MMKPLRKRHLQVWTILAILLPVGILIAWFAVPQQAKDILLQPAAVQPLPLVLHTYPARGVYEINLRSTTDSAELQLEWKNKQTLTYPTATIYKLPINDSDIQHGVLIGRIEARGNYYFKVDSTFKTNSGQGYSLVVYDFIHKKIIDKINL